MAGDWIKMRTDLVDDPAVITISAIVGLDQDHVVGKLHRLWSWADRHTADGNAVSVTKMWLDRYIGVTNFADAMVEAGWLMLNERGLTFPNFDRHNGKSAKKRLITGKRVAEFRKRNGNAGSVTKALPEKRREEKRRDNTPIAPKGAVDSIFDQFWKAYPRKVGKTAAGKAFARAAARIAPKPPSVIVEAAAAFSTTPKAKGEFCPYPATWLNRGSYDDDRADWQKQSTSTSKPANGQPHKPQLPTDEENANYSPY